MSLLLPNVMEDARFRAEQSILSSGIRSAMCAPLWFSPGGGGQDMVIGLVYLDSLQHAHSFGEEDLRILTALANVAAAKIENVRLLEESMEKRLLEEDMRMAAEIQSGLLPREAPKVAGYGLVGSNHPCRTVGGDYYDFAVEDGRLLLALGRRLGQGNGRRPPHDRAARVRARPLGGAELARRRSPHQPHGLPERPRQQVRHLLHGRARPRDRACSSYVNAGHNPPLLIRATGEVETLQEGGMVLGIFESVPYADGLVELRSGRHPPRLLGRRDRDLEPRGRGVRRGRPRMELALRGRGLDAAALQDEILREPRPLRGGGQGHRRPHPHRPEAVLGGRRPRLTAGP